MVLYIVTLLGVYILGPLTCCLASSTVRTLILPRSCPMYRSNISAALGRLSTFYPIGLGYGMSCG